MTICVYCEKSIKNDELSAVILIGKHNNGLIEPSEEPMHVCIERIGKIQ